MNDRLRKWNERYAARDAGAAFTPSAPLPQIDALVPAAEGRRALDLACGAGRHALYLAERGWLVDAVDGAEAGLEILRTEATRRGVLDRIQIACADLTIAGAFAIAPARYDLVCDFYYLQRDLFPSVRDAVRPGGLFIAAIHIGDGERLLPRGALRALAEGWGWEILHAGEAPSPEDGHAHDTATLIARRPRVAFDGHR